MISYLSSLGTTLSSPEELERMVDGDYDFNCLETFWEYKKCATATFIVENNHKFRSFMLDSGAFTFLNTKHTAKRERETWDSYVERYAACIVANKVSKFLELDIDAIVGYDEVKRLRAKLANLTGRQPIPVWHLSRGAKDWDETCRQYSYVAIGGFVTREIKRDAHFVEKMLKHASNLGTKVHGLGLSFTTQNFHSIDASSWNSAVRYGTLCHFNGTKVVFPKKPPGSRIKLSRYDVLRQSLNSNRKFTNYLEMKKS